MSEDKPQEATEDAQAPDLDRLAGAVATEGDPSPAPGTSDSAEASDSAEEDDQRPTTDYQAVGSAATADPDAPPANRPVDDHAATDLHPAAKPRPKSVPIAEVGQADQPEPSPERAGLRARRVAVWLGAAIVLTAALVLVGVLLPDQLPGSVNQPAVVELPVGTKNLDPTAFRKVVRPIDESSLRRDDLTDHAGPGDSPKKPGEPVLVPFEKRGDAIVIPARIRGPAGEKIVKMVLDTGATYSTVTTKTLDDIGVVPSAAKTRVATSEGSARRTLAVVDALATRAASVDGGLTVAICNACAVDDTEGLLGLNFTRHFIVTMDHDAGQLVLQPKQLTDKTIDVKPFVKLARPKRHQRGRRVALRFQVFNRAPRALQRLVIEASSSDQLQGQPRTTIPFLAANGQREASINAVLPEGVSARRLTLKVVRASW